MKTTQSTQTHNEITTQNPPYSGNNSTFTRNFKDKNIGQLNYTSVSPSIKLLHYKIKPNSDIKKEASIGQRIGRYHFIINLKDDIMLELPSEQSIALKKYDAFIYKGSTTAVKIKFNKYKSYEFLDMLIESSTLKSVIKNCKVSDFSTFLNKDLLAYKMAPDLKIIEHVHKIEKNGAAFSLGIGLVGQIYMVINSMIAQYIYETTKKETNKSSLKKWEISEVQKMSFKIQQNPEHHYSIAQIAEETGMSIPRLQIGFKEMHSTTIALYIREKRLQMAERLIRRLEHNISEVVYSIGLSSRSYFSRIFKERFNLSPTDYQKKFTA